MFNGSTGTLLSRPDLFVRFLSCPRIWEIPVSNSAHNYHSFILKDFADIGAYKPWVPTSKEAEIITAERKGMYLVPMCNYFNVSTVENLDHFNSYS